ncbi:MAG: L-threonylcarbamoyladenylate synthase [Actinomycetota bacterium]|nr:L-threonylcarbamoyladenylate synthase [Actinomycetota bacterium]
MTHVIGAHGDPPPPAAIEAAAEALRAGDIIGVPTDTVYGLAADPWHSGASDRLFLVKGRPRSVELPVFVAGAEQARELTANLPAGAERLMAEFWPGPLTIVAPRRPDLDADLGEDDATIGLRCPAHPVPLALCRRFGPYATTSANRHATAPISEAAQFGRELAGVALVLDAGPCRGEPSTVVDATGEVPKLLRAGGVDWERIMEIVASA